MDGVLEKLLTECNNAIAKAAKDKDECEGYIKTATGEKLRGLNTIDANIQYRLQRLSVCADILAGRSFVVVEKAGQVYVQQGRHSTLMLLSEKMGLKAEFVQGKADMP